MPCLVLAYHSDDVLILFRISGPKTEQCSRMSSKSAMSLSLRTMPYVPRPRFVIGFLRFAVLGVSLLRVL